MLFNKTFIKFLPILLYTAYFVTCQDVNGPTNGHQTGDNALYIGDTVLPTERVLTLSQTEKALNRRERVAPPGHERLFDPKDVVILNKHNFKDKIQGSPAVWYVLFYLHWCGHCVKFSPTWTKVGRHTKAKEWSKYIHVAVIDCAEPGYGTFCEEYGIRAYPAIKIFEPHSENDKGKRYTLNMAFEDIIKSMVDTISKQAFKPHPFKPATRLSVWKEKKPLHSNRKALKEIAKQKPKGSNKALPASKHDRSATVHLKDLVSTLVYMFHVEIPTTYTLQGSQFQALQHFISVLEQYFPDQKIRKSFKGLGKQLQGKNSIEGNALHSHISNLNLPKDITWVGCKGSVTWFRGYPCGVWQLFHTLTVRSYSSSQTDLLPSKYVLNSIIGYIKHFFSCKRCREKFVQMSQSVHKTVTTNKEAVLWLWEAHNQVNARLKGDATEDPEHPKIQFPPTKMCSKCRNKDSQWNKAEVLQFMRKFYDENLVKS